MTTEFDLQKAAAFLNAHTIYSYSTGAQRDRDFTGMHAKNTDAIAVSSIVRIIEKSDTPAETIKRITGDISPPDRKDTALNLLLCYAAAGNKLKSEESLLEAGANADAFHSTPLFFATLYNDNEKAFELLHSHKADFNLAAERWHNYQDFSQRIDKGLAKIEAKKLTPHKSPKP